MDKEKNSAILIMNQRAAKQIVESYNGKKLKKIDALRIHLLNGYLLTGWIMTKHYSVYSYRDAIYDLRKQGLSIEGKTIISKGVQHQEWWLACYDYDFVKKRTI